MKHYYSANDFFREKFGEKVYKLALDGGMTCPNRDGKVGFGGCSFCSGGSGDFAERAAGDISLQIERAKERVKNKISSGKYIAYFQSFTNTYAPTEKLERLFYPAIGEESVVALSVATRPDCLPEETVELLGRLNKIKPVFVELGLQTMHEQTAAAFHRGYGLPVYEKGVEDLHRAGINVITHLILGLPHETREMMVESARFAGRLSDGVKLQLLHILKGTQMEKEYLAGEVSPLGLEEYVEILANCVEVLPENVVVHRLTGDAPKRLLVAPLWSADKKRVLNAIHGYFDQNGIVQGSKA